LLGAVPPSRLLENKFDSSLPFVVEESGLLPFNFLDALG
jgi:hypothetical protein